MSKLIEDLVALQSLVRLGEAASPEQKQQMEQLRAAVPAPILGHFDRQVKVGRKGVALVRNGVCGECHIRLSHAMVYMLGRNNDLLICESCGSFVALAPGEAPATRVVATPKARRVAAAKVAEEPVAS